LSFVEIADKDNFVVGVEEAVWIVVEVVFKRCRRPSMKILKKAGDRGEP
jgi:hypothetical protein